MPASKVGSPVAQNRWNFAKLTGDIEKMSFQPSPEVSVGKRYKQKRKMKPKYGYVGPCVYDFTHFGAGGSSQDIPACYFQ